MTQASYIRANFQLAGHMAREAEKVCVSCSRVAKFDRNVYTFADGSKLTITKNRIVQVN